MFLFQVKKIVPFLLAAFLLGSCSEFQHVLKKGDLATKLNTAEKLYKEGNYKKALRVFDLITPAYRGKPQAERVLFYEADTYYNLRDYYIASYKMERFVAAFPKSDKAEEASFKAARSLYELSPRYSLDQKETLDGIDKLQNFINDYPESEYLEEANAYVKELQTKLEKKHYSIAKQYHHRELHKAAIKSFTNYLLAYPGSVYAEQALFYRLDSEYTLAINSYEELIPERLQEAKEYYEAYEKQSNDEDLKKKAQKIFEDITKRLQAIN
ncbi:outer membrane protein assembly factor BamD [Aquimarina agarivorans]|uniref:outer membrane protein assembly factor BamD n=1 Tax=Aquimarina agarivorans TaxID=980584 RepID=UPI000248FD3F|nr:outer membrane protein assembly factor BamD [Aquimarina agarivorans]